MNKKTKSLAVGIVAVLCFLLVFAIGFGVTGAWYQAQRQASGTVQMNQGIYLKFTNLATLNGSGDLTNKLEGKILDTDGNVLGSAESIASGKSEVEPGKTVTIQNPTIAAAARSVDFYARVKVTYKAKYYNSDRSDLEALEVAIAPETMQQLFGTDLAGQLQPGDGWVKVGDYFYYGSKADTTTTLAALPSATETNDGQAKALFANGNIVFADWTAANSTEPDASKWVEQGGPTVVVVPDPDGDGPETAVIKEIGQVIVTVEIEVIQKANVKTADLTAAGWAGVNVA